MTAPTDIPVNGDGTWRSPTWGEGGTYSPSAYEGNGAPQGTLIGPNDFNEPRRNVMRWVRAMRDRTVPSDRGLYASFLMKPSGGWNTGLGTLNGTIGVSYVMVDANDDGGVVVEFAVSAGSPHVFTASRDTYVNLNESGLVEYQAVANGAPAPTPSAGYVAIWKVVTDGTQLTSASVLVPSVPVLKAIQVEDLTVTGDLDVEGDATVEGTFDVTGAASFDSTLDVAGSATVGGALDVTGALSVDGSVVLCDAALDTFTCNGAASFNAGVLVTYNSGTALQATGVGAFNGIIASGGSTGNGVAATGGSTSGHAVQGTAQGPNSDGVRGIGANQSTSFGVNGIATNTSAYGVRGTAAASATTSGAGVRAEGLGDAPALSAFAVSGNAARLESDATSPARAPLVIVPQDADASTTQVGSVAVNSSRLNKIRHYDGSNYLSVHSSTNGYVFGVSAVSTSSNTSTSGDIGDITIVSEATGTVVVEVTGTWASPNDSATLTILLKDITGASTFATSQAFIAMDRDAEVGNTRVMPFAFRYPYTLPSAGTRLFRYRLNVSAGGASVLWYDTFMTVMGVG